jgi:hypothetical protein
MTAEEFKAAARPREELLAELAAATPTEPSPRPWMVVRQLGNGPEEKVCSYWSEWFAERRARQLTADADQLGVRYTVRRAEA